MKWKIGDRTRSGVRCPRAGYWAIAGQSRSSALFALGETMPLNNGAETDWVLTLLN